MPDDFRLNLLVVGGGMITEEVILPTIFQERRRGKIGEAAVASRRAATILRLKEVFASEPFKGYPDPARFAPEESRPEDYLKAMDDLAAPGLVVVATPDHFHTPVVLEALTRGFDVDCMKPLCLKVQEAYQILEAVERTGGYVLTDYHKRHDRAVRAARYKYRRGELGEILHGHAWIEEPKYMPLKYFANWCEKSSSFEYIGVHYADVFYYITGLLPRRLVAWGQKKYLPTQGKDAYDAIQAVIEWENGAAFWIQTSWVCSPKNSAMTNQGLQLHGTLGEYWADHKYRNLHFLTEEGGFEQYNPNFFKAYDSWEKEGLVDYVGYGYESLQQAIDDVIIIHRETAGLSKDKALALRKELLAGWKNLRALPEQALIGVAINEAVRLSIANNSRFVAFDERLYPHLER